MLTLVIPVYRNEGSIPDLVRAIAGIAARCPEGFECVFVVDGSPDRSYERLRDLLPDAPFAAKLVLLSRNFGSFAAIRVGLETGEGDRFAVMAADLQEPPELVTEMDETLRGGNVDVVVGAREAREDPWRDRTLSAIFWRLYRRFVVPDMPPGGVDVFACNRIFRDTLLSMEERQSSLVAQIFWLGFRRATVTYKRRKRIHGRSAWTFAKKLNYLLDSIFAFTDLPIRLLIGIGGAAVLTLGAIGLTAFFARLLGFIDVPGYTMSIIVTSFVGSVNLLGLGIIGAYAWRAYENTKQRPIAIPMSIKSFPGSAPEEGAPHE
ncbi:glycosyltransferase family 2 protein [Fulvimarina manganoxydans]|uniref:glycosyltransferase family 2 protein n=1 Tax=Fulvimarina manganoxydans TaxID=937218 RepID=UPI002355F3DB|nr:glycosyltransferase family 2 protein [Fulvimarina manganoxydans]